MDVILIYREYIEGNLVTYLEEIYIPFEELVAETIRDNDPFQNEDPIHFAPLKWGESFYRRAAV